MRVHRLARRAGPLKHVKHVKHAPPARHFTRKAWMAEVTAPKSLRAVTRQR